ncbi:aldo/keto reductase [Porticoccus sp. W117]|uniref:aldo/keto reductase n=1 Tax=Porticoccus sp. W117 TaxID=3054777 RepID=UPI0025978A2A|nr:aldo/keto reductase [Porticoccus sp. W117]MDM3870108.1 aldo/keto reductase [Porticoccus sp. W117]
MDYRNLGRSGLKVSALGLGTWLTVGQSLNQQQSRELVDSAVAAGVNHFDLADAYGNGAAERAFGELVKPLQRDALVIASKLFWPQSDDPNDCGLSRKHIRVSIERTLKNLQTDYLDIYYCHREDSSTPVEETVWAMHDLIAQGKILYWGTSMWSDKTLKKALAFAEQNSLHKPIVEQPPYNLLERWVEKKQRFYQHAGIGMVCWSPLAGGALTGKYVNTMPVDSRGANTQWLQEILTDGNNAKIAQFVSLAEQAGVAPATLAISWLLKRNQVASVLLGATSAEQLQQTLAAQEYDLPVDLDRQLSKLFA